MSSKRCFFSRSARNRPRLFLFTGVVVLGVLGCDAGSTDPELDLDPSFMVGDWLAEALVMTSVANPDVVDDLVALGATFTLSVQPSGRYTAILQGFGQSSSEIGTLTVDGPDVVLRPQSPPGPTSRAVWERVDEKVILVGDSDFDFNRDGTTEAATLRQVLIPSN